MKKIVFTLMYLCFLSLTIVAQDLNPGQQSQGLLESRNVTVDHCTGIFHYNIPLYTLKSGDYELPISLRYTGKGVKVNDNPGLVGYNWTLDTGGVVTRTVRGGIPDEDINYGYLKLENDTVPLSEDATRVNRHKRDGECDIFTAVFGGKSVNFIIRKAESNFYADPLERTDVRIECVHSNNLINGWVVTDNDGTRYTYMRKEWTTDLNKQDEISFNGLSNLEYVSSWHLTEIEPVNSKAITFEYSNGNITRFYQDTYETIYDYGKILIEPDYSFETYKNDFNRYMEEAKKSLILENERLQMEYNLYIMNKEIQWNNRPEYIDLVIEKNKKDTLTTDTLGVYTDMIMEYFMRNEISTHMQSMLEMNHRILGMAGNFSPLYTSAMTLLQQLESLVETYRTSPSVSTNFLAARNVLKQYILGTTKKYSPSNNVKGIYSFRIVSPLLTSIRSEEKILFKYNSEKGCLTTLGKETWSGNTISSHKFSYRNGKLVQLSLQDRDSLVVETVGMDYYVIPSSEESIADLYGFYTSYRNGKFEVNMDGEFAKSHSLKEIRPADGGRIRLDYELNGLAESQGGKPYGGIRIKSIILEDQTGGHNDTISYHYDSAIHTYLNFPDNHTAREYLGFTDSVWHSRIKAKGHATLSSGNNGLYYPSVRERISGQGTRSFFFNFTTYDLDLSYAQWITALPAYTVEQDEKENVTRVLQSIYYTDTKGMTVPCLFSENLVHLESASYGKSLPQMEADKNFMDRQVLETYYRNLEGIYLDGTFINPHWEYYETNILPRIPDKSLGICYPLHYGGATVLAEQREYRPAEKDYTDFWELMYREQPYSRTIYHYDSLDKHTRPTRIVSYDACGDSTVVHQVYAGDMAATASGAISAMKEANILSLMVKRAVVKNGELQEEEVTVYGTAGKEDGCFYAPEKVLVRKGGNSSYIPDTFELYSGSVADYQEHKKMTSTVIGDDSYLPTEMTEQGTHTAFVHDPNSKWCILQTIEIPSDKVIAVDAQHYRQNTLVDSTDTIGHIIFLAEKLQEGIDRYDPNNIQHDSYQSFRTSEYYQRGKRMIELLGKGTGNVRTEVSALLGTCSSDGYIGIEEYILWQIWLEINYFPMETTVSHWDISTEEMDELGMLLMEELHMNNGNNLLDYLRTYDGSLRGGLNIMPQALTVLPEQNHYMLHLVPNRRNALVTYTIVHSGGTTEKTVELFGITQGALRKIPLDLGGYANVTGITVTGFCGVQYLALVPEGTEFEATSYNEDGTISIKFDHNGKMRHHEYDSAGRLIRVRDENGKTLEENDYHVKNTTL